ncbi:hypothetical protein KZ877_09725, partial [Pseudomonas aeruginosa]|uniref:hypothetical protein n=1 Tax=Pseudomonas aeruginosa TaxID=287 RepID=UPI001CA4AA2B
MQCRIRITSLHIFFAALLLFTLLLVITRDQSVIALNRAVAGAECNTVIELKPEHHAALPWHF